MTSQEKTFEFLTFQHVASEPPKKFLIQGLLAENELSMIFGPPKVGKSYVVLDFIAALIRGHCPFAGQFLVAGPVPVVYATGEGQTGLANRLRSLRAKWDLSDEEMDRLRVVKTVPQLFRRGSDSHVEVFVRQLRDELGHDALQGGVLVLDTWARASGGADENTSKDTTEILDALSFAKDALGCTVVVVHHANKGGDIRGSSNIQAGFDNVMHVRRGADGTRVFGCAIAKDAEEAPEIAFDIGSHEFEDDHGDVHKGGLVEWTGELSAEETQRATVEREVLLLLSTEAVGEDNAMSLKQILEQPAVNSCRKTVSEIAERLAAAGTLRTVLKPTYDRNGQVNRKAVHFYCTKDHLN